MVRSKEIKMPKGKNMIGIIGQGFVGKAVYENFKKYYKTLTHDLKANLCNSTYEEIVENCQIIFLCVPTPMNKDGSCHTDIVENELGRLNRDKGLGYDKAIIVLKSTVPPDSTKQYNTQFENLDIIFNPEFLTERNAIEDYKNQNRIILGGPRPASTKLVQVFSKVFPKARIIKTNSTYAEMIKYTTNAFLSTKVSFANEIYQICEKVGADYDKVIEYATMDDRLGNSHWNVPGPDGDFGFGGHCFPKDMEALLHLTKELKTQNNVLQAVLETNETVRQNRDWENMKGRAVI